MMLLQTIIFVIVLSLLGFPISDPDFFTVIAIICSLFILLGSMFGCFMLTCLVTKEGLRQRLPFSPNMDWDEITKAKKLFYGIRINGNSFNRNIIFPGPFILSNKEELYTFLKKNIPEGNPFLEIIQGIKV